MERTQAFTGVLLYNAGKREEQDGHTICNLMVKNQEAVFAVRMIDASPDFVREFLTKGRKIFGLGHLKRDVWQDKRGIKKQKTILVADLLEVISAYGK
jgi:hypothetical protein